MKHIRFFILTISLFIVALATAQTRGVVDDAIPGDNKLRYYRFAIAIAPNSYTTDFGSNYENVKKFWQECEDFMNEVYVPLGMCFDVVINQSLLLGTDLPVNNNLPVITGVTDLINTAIGSGSYDIGICITYRNVGEGNTGLSAVNGAYSSTIKANSYAIADKWVVAHEVGHLFGADHTTEGEGSLMDNIGEFFSYPSIKKIRDASVGNGPGNAFKYETVANKAPAFTAQMKDTYRIPKGACLSIPVYANDADGHSLRYAAIGCSSSTVGDITGNSEKNPHFASLKPQASNIIDYRPEYVTDGGDGYLPVDGTNIPTMGADSYSIAILVNDMPEGNSYDYLNSKPFYSNYSVWDATIEIVDGNPFTASISPAQNSYTAGSNVTVTWGVNNNVFTEDSRVRITMSTDYGKTFNHVLADDVRALDGSKAVTLPNVNVGNVDVDFSSKYVSAVRSMRAGIIRVEIIDGAAYTLTTLSPANGGGFTVTGGSDAPDPVLPITYTINVQANPATSGTATVNGNSTATVDAGSTVTLTATPYSGDYKFDGWYLNDVQVSTSSTYTPTVTGNVTYVAKFSAVATPEPEPGQQATNTVSVQAEPAEGGTATVEDKESVTVDDGGSYVFLKATANSGYEFVGWYLNSTQVTTSSIYSLKALPGETYIAKFSKEGGVEPEPEQPAQTDGYYYVINRDTNRREYLYNNALHTGNSLYFTLQSDAAVSTNNGIWYIDFNDDKTLGIKNGDGKPLVAGASWGGSIAGSYDVLTINETFNVGDFCYYYFSEAINCTNGTDNFKVNNEHFVTTWSDGGNAQDNQWRLEPIDMQGKSVYEVDIVGSNVYVTYTNGTNTEYAYDGGFFITNETIDASKLKIEGNENAEIVVEDNVIRAFPKYTITVSAENSGTVESTATTVTHGDKVTLTATVPDGYTFDAWYASDGKPVSNENPYTFEVTGNIDYTAKFTLIPVGNTYTISVTSNNPGGLVFINTTGVTEGVYTENTTVKLSAVEDVNNSACLFEGWYNKEGNRVSTYKNYEVKVSENAEYEARFVKGYVVEVKVPNLMLRVCQVTISDEKGNFGTGRLVVRSGEKVTLSAYLDDAYIAQGYVFSGWEDIGGNVVNEQPYTITVTQDVSYLAVVGLASYTLKVRTPDKNMGSVSAVSGAQAWGDEIEVAYMANAYLSAIPNDGYVFVNWTLNGEVVNLDEYPGTTHEYVLPAVTDLNAMKDVEYVAHFMETPNVTYNVNVENRPNIAGVVSMTPEKGVGYGGTVILTANANEGYAFENWTTLDGEVVGTNPVLTVNNVTKNLNYVANYKVTDPLAGRWFRLKEMNSGKYMNVSNNDQHSGGVNGGVNVADFDRSRNDLIFNFIKSGTGYKLLSKTEYYIYCQTWNVDAYSKEDGTILTFNPTGNKHEYRISSSKGWFKVETAKNDNSGILYVYCDAVENAAATWVLEEVADKSKLVPLIAEATELFNQVATTDKTKINIAGKIISNAPHNSAEGNTGEYKDGGGYDALTDTDPSTYFHSRWGGTPVYEPHYLQINLGEGESLSNFCFEYATRETDENSASPAPTEIEVRVSEDGSTFGAPVATYTSGTNATKPLPSYTDFGKTLWLSDVISSQNNTRAIRLTVTNSAGPQSSTVWYGYHFFAMGTLNLYSTQPSLKEEYKDYPAITEELLLALSASLANANDVNNNDAATTEMVNEAIQTLRAQKEALESALVPASFTLKQLTASDLMKKTGPTYIAVKNISGTNNHWFAGTSNEEEFRNSNVLVWEPVVEGKSGSYYIRNTYGKYIQNTTLISFGGVEGAAVFTAVNATSKGSGETKFNGDNGDENTLANINTADDPNLVRFVTGTQWINVQSAGGNPTYNNAEGGYTVHFVYEATMVNEFTVNVTDAQFATFYAPVKVELPDNAKAYIINKIESHDWVSLAEVEGNVLPEKTAIILHSETSAACKLAVTNETADAKVDGNKLLGTVNDAYIVKNSGKLYYILAKRNDAVGMYVPVLGENVNKFKNRANKAYLVLDEIEVPQMSAGFRFILPGATAVEEITTENADVETIYDLQGRKLTEIVSPGIYIINGKKVFVK